MNIFFLDKDPAWVARYHVDRHVISQIYGTARLLYAAHIMLDGVATANARIGPIFDKATINVNYPYARWVRESDCNYTWTAKLFKSLVREYELRNCKEHPLVNFVEVLERQPLLIPMASMTDMPQTQIPVRFRQPGDPVYAHRLCYFWMRRELARWSAPARTPFWWRDLEAKRVA